MLQVHNNFVVYSISHSRWEAVVVFFPNFQIHRGSIERFASSTSANEFLKVYSFQICKLSNKPRSFFKSGKHHKRKCLVCRPLRDMPVSCSWLYDHYSSADGKWLLFLILALTVVWKTPGVTDFLLLHDMSHIWIQNILCLSMVFYICF